MSAATLEAYVEGRENSFDVLRLGAATAVLISHSFVVTGNAEPLVGRWPLGTLGVEVFFVISGFLLAMSWARHPGLRDFAVRRALRIMPALIVTVVACAFLLGPLVTTLAPSAYVGDVATPEYVTDNVVAVGTGGLGSDIALDLPGVFESNPDHSVNRSLWTLPIEIEAYAVLALIGLAGALSGSLLLAAGGFFLLSIAPAGVTDLPLLGAPLDFLRGADGLAAHFLALFFTAALFHRYRSRIPMRLDLALLAGAAALLSLGTPVERGVLLIAMPYLVLVAAFRSPAGLRRLTRPGDVSYGIYLLAFPVQQTIVWLWAPTAQTPLAVGLIALPVTYMLAFASWHGLERRALRLKHRFSGAGEAPSKVGRPETVVTEQHRTEPEKALMEVQT
jgi:peptidoglycan/LPS O-acetylase OafA/YrhL